MKLSVLNSVLLVLVLVCINTVLSEPPVRNSGTGWSQQQQTQTFSQQQSGGYATTNNGGGYGPPAGNFNNGGQNGGGWGQQQQQPQQQALRNGGGGWGQQQAQVQSGGNGGWGQQAQTQQANSGGNGWGSGDNQMQQQKDSGNGGWGAQVNLELDSANLQKLNLNPREIFRSIIGIPRRIISFIRESGLYILFIPLIIILPLMLLAFNAGRLLGGLGHGWGWGKRSLTSTVGSGIVGYLKSPAWQKVAETLMDEHVFDRIMKSLDEFKPQTKKQN